MDKWKLVQNLFSISFIFLTGLAAGSLWAYQGVEGPKLAHERQTVKILAAALAETNSSLNQMKEELNDTRDRNHQVSSLLYEGVWGGDAIGSVIEMATGVHPYSNKCVGTCKLIKNFGYKFNGTDRCCFDTLPAALAAAFVNIKYIPVPAEVCDRRTQEYRSIFRDIKNWPIGEKRTAQVEKCEEVYPGWWRWIPMGNLTEG